ncbi:MAG: hypothetical protein ACK6DZ_25645, partial [Acidobacteriota bacterium]
RAISSLLYRFFFIDLSFHFERSYDFCWYDFRASGHSVIRVLDKGGSQSGQAVSLSTARLNFALAFAWKF